MKIDHSRSIIIITDSFSAKYGSHSHDFNQLSPTKTKEMT